MIKNARIVSKDTNSDEYHANNAPRGTPDFRVSSSSLRAFYSCPDKWRSPIVDKDGNVSFYERTETEATIWGNMFDCFILTPKQFPQRYITVPEDAPRKPSSAQRNAKKPSPETIEAIKWWDIFEQNTKGKTIVSDSDIYNVEQAAKRFLEFPGMKRFIDGCDKQVWIEAEWHDEATGLVVPTKCLIDLLPNLESEYAILDPSFAKVVADLKTTKSAAPASWDRWAHAVGYEVQAAWNSYHAMAVDGREIEGFAFLLSENHAPWQPARRMMTLDNIEHSGDVDSGWRQCCRMMADYCKALKTGRFPGYDDTDEAMAGGWTLVRPNPFQEQAKQFAPKFTFGEEEEPEEFVSVCPT